MKTPEQMAEEYGDRIERQAILCVSLLAMNDGEYFAAKKAYKAGYQAAKDQLADADKVMNSSNNSNGWISVKEQLPEFNVDVLICVNFTVHSVTYKYCSVALFDGTCWDDDGSYSRNSVTHWMPLPKLPEEK